MEIWVLRVFGTCWVGYMRVSTGDERQSVRSANAMHWSPRVWMNAISIRIGLPAPRMIGRGLKACLADLRDGDVLIVWKLDRLGRSLSHLLTIITDLKNRGVAFRSITEQMDTTTPHGEFLFNVFGSLAQFERALIRERVNAGLAAAKRRGPHRRPTAIA